MAFAFIWSPKSKKVRVHRAFLLAPSALGLAQTMPSPAWQHQPFLRSGDGEIDTPLVHAEVDAANRANAIHVEHRRMVGGIDGAPHRLNVAGDFGGRLIVDDQHAFDGMDFIGAQRFLNTLRGSTHAPFLVLHDHVEADALREIDP